MTYLLAGTVFVAAIVLAACSLIYVESTGQQPVNIQTTDPTNVLGSQNVTSADRASRGSAHGDITTDATADSVPTVTVPINNPVTLP